MMTACCPHPCLQAQSYEDICGTCGHPRFSACCRYPGTETSYNQLIDSVDHNLLMDAAIWTSTTPEVQSFVHNAAAAECLHRMTSVNPANCDACRQALAELSLVLLIS
jgi:hypothetical protein